jgi:hypothetical protein
MKSLIKYLSILAAVACVGTAGLRAEEAKPSKPERKERKEHKEEGPKLTDEEKAKLKAAKAAVDKDPAVIKAKDAFEAAREKARESKEKADRQAAMEAGKALREAVKAAMIKADPSIAEILKKMPERPFGERGEHGPRKGGDKPAEAPAKPAAE